MKKIYFIGINGIGMRGLAKIMKTKKYEVVGADISRSYVTEEMEQMGIKIYRQHLADQVKDCNMVIASSAIKPDNPEYDYAKKNGIKILKRGELLAMLLNSETGIAIAGTHGKTTTTSMMSSAMLALDPTIVIGGVLPEIGSNSKTGYSEYFVAEADESDNSFLYMYPKYSVITNVEEDHMENHGSIENIKKSFSMFIDQTKIETIVCIDNKNIVEIINSKKLINQKMPLITTYSTKDKNADIYATGIKIEDQKTTYDVSIHGENIGRFALSIPGEHNILNSLPVIYLANKFGVPIDQIKEKLINCKGAKRRYDILYNNLEKDIKIIDDYAHHPTEINATLHGARSIEKGDIIVIFQPHRYSRIKFLLNNFKNAFDCATEIVLLPIYSAGEKDEFGVTIEDLEHTILNKNISIEKGKEKIKETIREKILNSNGHQIFMFMGAGDISTIAHDIANGLEKENG
jgi:UDP-N-acetylmuramate--alanine ligase